MDNQEKGEGGSLQVYNKMVCNINMNFEKAYKRHCKHLQRSQSHSVELIFAPWLENISGLTLVPKRH